MAHRKMVITEAGAQNYRTRALTAGDPITLSAGDARLFSRLGWAEEPKARAPAPIIPTVEEVLGAEVVAPKKRRRKAAAKK